MAIEPGWVFLSVALAFESSLVALLILPAPNNNVRGRVAACGSHDLLQQPSEADAEEARLRAEGGTSVTDTAHARAWTRLRQSPTGAG